MASCLWAVLLFCRKKFHFDFQTPKLGVFIAVAAGPLTGSGGAFPALHVSPFRPLGPAPLLLARLPPRPALTGRPGRRATSEPLCPWPCACAWGRVSIGRESPRPPADRPSCLPARPWNPSLVKNPAERADLKMLMVSGTVAPGVAGMRLPSGPLVLARGGPARPPLFPASTRASSCRGVVVRLTPVGLLLQSSLGPLHSCGDRAGCIRGKVVPGEC